MSSEPKLISWRLSQSEPGGYLSIMLCHKVKSKLFNDFFKKKYSEIRVNVIDFDKMETMLNGIAFDLNPDKMHNNTRNHLKKYTRLGHRTKIIGQPPKWSFIKHVKNCFCSK